MRFKMKVVLFLFIMIGSSSFAEDNPNHSIPLIEQLIDAQKYDEAINQLDVAIKTLELQDTGCKLYYLRGKVFFKKHDIKQALNEFNKAIEIDPRCTEAYNGRGFILNGMEKCDLPKALIDLNKAIELNPQLSKAYHNRAYTYYLDGSYGNSWNDINVARSLRYQIKDKFADDVEQLVKVVNGEYVEYYPDQKLKKKSFFRNGKYEGVQLSFFENGDVEEKAEYSDGILNGVRIMYSEGNQIDGILTYKLGKLNGLVKALYPNGQIMYEQNFKDGKLDGVVKYYSDDGKLNQELVYRDDVVKQGKFYDKDGRLLNK